MRLTIASVLAVCVVCSASPHARAAPASANACKECSDHRKRCMANYPGPTCKNDYDICMKNCRKK